MQKPEDWVEPPFAGDVLHIPTILIDGMQGASFVAGVVKINMYQYVQDFSQEQEPSVKRMMVGRLAMSEATLRGINSWLTTMIEDLDAAALSHQSDKNG